MCDLEFTVERGRLWMLQTRVGKRTAAAAFRIAADLLHDGLIDEDEALRRVTGDQLAQLMFPCFDTGARSRAGGGRRPRLARRGGRRRGVQLRRRRRLGRQGRTRAS